MAVDAKMVKELRDRTGAGMMECKKALEDSGGDVEKASDLLRARGLAKAAKKVGRETKEGLVFAKIAADGRSGTLVELACETDFVANNAEFRGLGKELVEVFLKSGTDGAIATAADEVKERVSPLTAKMGENIQVRRAVRYGVKAGAGAIYAYVHAGDKIGCLMELGGDKDSVLTSDTVKTLGRELCMQVAALGPRFVSSAQVPADQRERQMAVFKEEAIRTGKPANVAEKIAAGRLGKELEAYCLLDQGYIRDEAVKIKDLIAREGQKSGGKVEVRRFTRFQIGEALE